MINNRQRPFKGFNKLIEKASVDHNINVSTSTDSELREFLLSDSYYSLVNGYQRAFERTPQSEIFQDNISLAELDLIYFFESNLSSTLFQNILYIEKRLKTALQYVVSKHLGTSDVSEYLTLNRQYYSINRTTVRTLKNFLGKATGYFYEVDEDYTRFTRGQRNNENSHQLSDSLINYRATGNVPPWILVNDLTFGETFYWFNALKDFLKQEVIFLAFPKLEFKNGPDRHSNENNLTFINNALTMIKDLRNNLAHGSLLNKVNFSISLSWSHVSKLFELNGLITRQEFNHGKGKKDLLAIYLIFFILLEDTRLTLLIPSTEVAISHAYESFDHSFTNSLNSIFNIPADFLDVIKSISLK
ncbi:Abi family protein [Weissella cibaria]|uniref:Abi family protein n=1 Tax=Weissella cibaria TaxID=137591 RepID=UPI0036DD4102